MKTDKEASDYMARYYMTRQDIKELYYKLLSKRTEQDESASRTKDIKKKLRELVCEFDFKNHPEKEKVILIHARFYILKNFPDYAKRLKF